MGLFDWIGPTSLTKRRSSPWDLGTVTSLPERKASYTIDDIRAVIVTPLVHGPGASDQWDRRGDGNSAVFACLQAIATALAEPPLRVYRTTAGDRVEVESSPLGELLARPNPHLSLSTLLAYLSNCLHVDGNAYWRKIRAGNPETGNVVELWPISPSRIHPRTERGSGEFISVYRYYVRPGVHEDISPDNIVHFRMGLDDRDHRLGCAPLKRLLREISSDDQATRYADRLLANLAINGLSLEFDKDTGAIDQATADELKRRIQAAYGGDNVGAVSVLSPGAKLVSHGFSPEQMDMKTLHRVPEERIAAVLGVPAIVAGLGAGLDRSTYSNFAEAREAFTEMKLVPTWRAIADTLTMALVPDFSSERGVSVAFMIDDVRALQDDQDARAVRLKTYVDAGILDPDEARAEIGYAPRATVPAPGNEQRSGRPRIVTLPRLAVKAPDDDDDSVAALVARLQAMRPDLEPDWIEAAVKGLRDSETRILRRLRSGLDTAEGLVPEVEAELFGQRLRPLQLALLDDVHRAVVAELGIAFDLDDPGTREYLRSAGTNIGGILDTTREAVRAELLAGQAAGESIDQLAARLQGIAAFSDGRARTIARTELGTSQNLAALQNYRTSGVVLGLRVYDGDSDAECQAMNGRVFFLDRAPAALQHPNCVRAFAPVLNADTMERAS